MYIGFYWTIEEFNKNGMFKSQNSNIGDNLLYPFIFLGDYLKSKGHKVNTIDMDDIDKFDAIVFIGVPDKKDKYFNQVLSKGLKNIYAMIVECEYICPNNWDRESHKFFKRIFVWADSWVDGKKYIKYYYPSKIPEDIDFGKDNLKKLCTMVVVYKFYNAHPLELYSERLKAIKWFQENHPEDFEFYGKGWDRYQFNGIFSALNKSNILAKIVYRFNSTLSKLEGRKLLAGILKKEYPSYRGAIKSKREVLQRYKFAICYENTHDIPGYITEKIFDCFFAGCIPIYWGAPNITEIIPESTFIDRRNFKTYEELYEYIKNMPDKEYNNYINAIKEYVTKNRIRPFDPESFAKNITNTITNDFEGKTVH